MSRQQSAHVSVTGRRRGPSDKSLSPSLIQVCVWRQKNKTKQRARVHSWSKSKVIISHAAVTSSTQDPGTTCRQNEALGGWWGGGVEERRADRKWEKKLHMWTRLGFYLKSQKTGSECTSHPSPVRAQQAWMCHWWSLTEVSWRLWEISATDMQPFTSCLLAKISSPAFLKSWRQRKRRLKKWRSSQTITYSPDS